MPIFFFNWWNTENRIRIKQICQITLCDETKSFYGYDDKETLSLAKEAFKVGGRGII